MVLKPFKWHLSRSMCWDINGGSLARKFVRKSSSPCPMVYLLLVGEMFFYVHPDPWAEVIQKLTNAYVSNGLGSTTNYSASFFPIANMYGIFTIGLVGFYSECTYM